MNRIEQDAVADEYSMNLISPSRMRFVAVRGARLRSWELRFPDCVVIEFPAGDDIGAFDDNGFSWRGFDDDW